MTFGEAMDFLKSGKEVRRENWNGVKKIHLASVIHNENGTLWSPTQKDILAEDWVEVEEIEEET